MSWRDAVAPAADDPDGGQDGEQEAPGSPIERKVNWTRKEIFEWLSIRVQAGRRFIVGIDHAFSFPASYFDRHGLDDWDGFLADFCRHWPTDRDDVSVESLREENPPRCTPPAGSAPHLESGSRSHDRTRHQHDRPPRKSVPRRPNGRRFPRPGRLPGPAKGGYSSIEVAEALGSGASGVAQAIRRIESGRRHVARKLSQAEARFTND